eukprot:COSAG01_NODE_39583_length_474_cov_5.962667_1_plen_96_part_01
MVDFRQSEYRQVTRAHTRKHTARHAHTQRLAGAGWRAVVLGVRSCGEELRGYLQLTRPANGACYGAMMQVPTPWRCSELAVRRHSLLPQMTWRSTI